MDLLGWTFSIEIIVIGALTGLAYAVMAAGLVLVYRATKVINFAHGEIGALGAAVMAKIVLDSGWNYWVAMAVVVAAGGLLGALIEVSVIRRLSRAPQLALLVATIGVSQVLLVGQLLLPQVRLENMGPYPSPLDRSAEIGSLVLRSPHFMMIAFAPAVIVGLAVFLNRTPWGLAIRASAENRDAAELSGISTRKVSTLVWVVAGLLSTLTVILVNPLRNVNVGLTTVEAMGPGLLLRALAAALVGRLVSLPLALVGGVAVGVSEALLFANVSSPAWAELFLFLGVLVLLVVRGGSQGAESGLEQLGTLVRPLPSRLAAVPAVRRMPMVAGSVALAAAVVAPLVLSSASQTFQLGRVLVFAIIGLSVTMLTGWAGQLSLGQFAFVGLGAMTVVFLHDRGMPFGPAMGYAVVAGVLVSLLVGFPALRLRGLFLAVTTLAFAVASRQWLFTRPAFLGDSSVVFVQPGRFLGLDFDSQRTFYYLCLAGLLLALVVTARLRRSGTGRSIIAVRDNERAAASFGIAPSATKLWAFTIPGALASFAGALLAGLTVQFGPQTFDPADSLAVVAMTVIGGLGSITGALLGALYVVGLPALFGSTLEIRLATSGIGLLVLLLYLPGGLAQLVFRARDVLADKFADAADADPGANGRPSSSASTVTTDVATAGHDPAEDGSIDGASDDRDLVLRRPRTALPIGAPALRVSDVVVRFGGLTALGGVSLDVGQGEIVGLIGSNGAGKSTLMNVISGFQPATSGTVEILGHDATDDAPHLRARLGMGRVFQDARLFPGLNVREAIQLSLESDDPTDPIPAMLGFAPARDAERRKRASAQAYLSLYGLDRYADAFIADLSTGTRRIVELACLTAQGARLLLLDEPTAGVAQRETEAFAPLIQQVAAELEASVLIIEHDMPMIMSISDRVHCYSAGVEIAAGSPEAVRNDPAVIAAYLGTDERAIARSGEVLA